MSTLAEYKYLARKTVTFSNTSGTVNLFTVTGMVVHTLMAVCKTSLASEDVGTLEVGVDGWTDMWFATATATDIDAGTVYSMGTATWVTPPTSPAGWDTMLVYSQVYGQDTIATVANQIDSGVIEFYCLWTPLSSDGLVEAA